jgi:hypothetical protein
MTGALIRKELRDLLPWGVLCVVLGALDLVPELVRQLDMRRLRSRSRPASPRVSTMIAPWPSSMDCRYRGHACSW